MSASPLSLSRTLPYAGFFILLGLFAKVETDKSLYRHRLAGFGACFLQVFLDRLSGILDEDLFCQANLLIEFLKASVGDLVHDLCRLPLVLRLGAVDLHLP